MLAAVPLHSTLPETKSLLLHWTDYSHFVNLLVVVLGLISPYSCCDF